MSDYLKNELACLDGTETHCKYYVKFMHNLIPVPIRFVVNHSEQSVISLESMAGIYLGGPIIVGNISIGNIQSKDFYNKLHHGYVLIKSTHINNAEANVYSHATRSPYKQYIISNDSEYMIITDQNDSLWMHMIKNAIQLD